MGAARAPGERRGARVGAVGALIYAQVRARGIQVWRTTTKVTLRAIARRRQSVRDGMADSMVKLAMPQYPGDTAAGRG